MADFYVDPVRAGGTKMTTTHLLAVPQPCRICEQPTFLADDESAVHPCCVLWDELVPGKPCVACSESRAHWRQQERNQRKARRIA